MTLFGSRSSFDKLLEKATSQLLLEPDWDAILQICDSIRQEDAQPKYAIQALKRKISSDNPHVALLALQVLESCVKNCGSPVHSEIATKEFMEFLKDAIKTKADPVKGKILELIQIWSHAFRNESSYRIVQDTFNLMRMEGYQFPQLRESDAMFSAEKAPEWKDGEMCHRCRTQFTFTTRKHHCRCCGEVFCGKCSSKNSLIPKFGIEREVRVCDSCFDQLNKTSTRSGGPAKEEELPAEYLNSALSRQPQQPPAKSEDEIREEEELQLALALSQSEAEEKEKQKKRLTSNYGYSSSNNSSAKENVAKVTQPVTPTFDTSEMDPELAKYLNRNYWQQKADEVTAQPSAPSAGQDKKGETGQEARVKVQERMQNGEVTGAGEGAVEEREEVQATPQHREEDQKQFLEALQSSIEIFVNRMKSDHMRGRSIANDSAVQTLFLTINQMHPQLLAYIHQQDEKRTHYESLQDRLAQLRDAREALDVLRDEHKERRRREQEELERQRAIAMAQKLEVLRQKKHEYLEYQRQLALQRMRDQEAELYQRMELQKRLQMERAMQYGSLPGYGPAQPPQQGMMAGQMYAGGGGGGSVEGSPRHQPHAPAPAYGNPMQYASMPYGMGPLMGPESLAQQQGQVNPAMNNWPPSSTMPPQTDATTQSQAGMYHPGQASVPYGQQAAPPQHQQMPPNNYVQGYMPGAPQQPPASMPMHPGDYNAYNMQGMTANLPPATSQGPGGPPPQSQHPQMAPQQGYNMVPGAPDQRWGDPAQHQFMPGHGQPPMGAPPTHPQGGPPPQQSDNQLISFD